MPFRFYPSIQREGKRKRRGRRNNFLVGAQLDFEREDSMTLIFNSEGLLASNSRGGKGRNFRKMIQYGKAKKLESEKGSLLRGEEGGYKRGKGSTFFPDLGEEKPHS